MKRHAKNLEMGKKTAFQTLLDGTLTPKERSNNVQRNSFHFVQSKIETVPFEKYTDEDRNEVPKSRSAFASTQILDNAVLDREQADATNSEVNHAAFNNFNSSSSNKGIAIPPLFKECLNLYKAKQYRSAESLAMYNLTSLSPNSIYKAHAFELIADCAFHQAQHLRASAYYKQAFEHCHHDAYTGSANVVSSTFQAQLKLKEANCLNLSGNVVEASTLLETFIPIRSPFRTFAISMDLGKMYMTIGRYNDARRCFLDVLHKNIYALEAIECLAQLGSEKSAVSKIVQQKVAAFQLQHQMDSYTEKLCFSKENAKHISETTHEQNSTQKIQKPSLLLPINDIVNAIFYSYRGSSHALHAWNYWCKLLDHHPNHTHLLLQMALLQARYPFLLRSAGGINTNSLSPDGQDTSIFAKIRNLDPNFMEGMDIYANILAKQGNKTELCRLSSSFLDIDDKRHEGWVSLALYHHICGDIEKSLAFLEKAIECNPRSAFCHHLMGSILQAEEKFEHAVMSYFRANEISKDIRNYEGLVEVYLSCAKYKEAVCTAKEAISFAPRDPRAMTLVGLALMSAPGSKDRGKDKAKRTLQKAYNVDPTCRKTLFALVDLHLQEEEFEVCIDLIKRGIDESDCSYTYMWLAGENSTDKLYSKLAEVYTLKKEYSNALECFHKALSINPHSNDAQRSMDDLEKVMKYVDNSVNTEGSEDSHYNHSGRFHQHKSYRYDETELESVVRAL